MIIMLSFDFDVTSKMQALGLKASLEEIYGTAYAAAVFLKNKRFRKKVYVVGGSGQDFNLVSYWIIMGL